MHWDIHNILKEMDDTIINLWRHAETILNEEEFSFSTHAIFKRITGTKADLSSADGRTRFNTFTTAYNSFCANNNFPAHEGFLESQDQFFKYYLANSPKTTALTPTSLPPPLPKSIRFTSAPPIDTLTPPSSSPEGFPTLQASNKAPISYASMTSTFIPVTH
jgi:hypothetical protein